MDKKIMKYQEVDAKLKKIENELANSEERKKAVVAKKFLESNVEVVNKLDARAGELVMALENVKDLQQKLSSQEADFAAALETATDENEINFLIKKIDELIAKIKNLNSEIARISNEMQALIKEFSTNKNTEKNAKAQYEKYGKLYSELKASKAEEIKAIETELAQLKKYIDKDTMDKYLAKRADKTIFPIFFEVKEGRCGHCSTELSLFSMSKLKNGEILECEYCRRLLFKD